MKYLYSLRYSTLSSLVNLHPYFITGFSDAECCFNIKISQNNKYSVGWLVELSYQLNLHQKDQALLKLIQTSLGGIGIIRNKKNNSIEFRISSLEGLTVIIDHFDKYPLITQKLADYILFKQAFELIKNKEHLTMEGIKKLIAIKASINLGLSEKLEKVFPDIKPEIRPLIENQEINDSNWIAGFASGEACFFVNVKKSKTTKVGESVTLRFQISQHSRDKLLLKNFLQFFGCGNYYQESNRPKGEFVVLKFSDIYEKIIPFLNKYPIIGIKALDFADFCKVAEIMKAGGHLTPEGLKKIKEIKAKMNTNRINYSADPADLNFSPKPHSFQSSSQQSNFSTINFNLDKLYALFLEISTGFCDAESFFSILICEEPKSINGCGETRLRPNRDLADFLIQKFPEIVEKIIPFFDKYPVLGAKALSYVAFKKVASIMQKKEHLSEPRLSEILSSKFFP